jgi:hypothetical protein
MVYLNEITRRYIPNGCRLQSANMLVVHSFNKYTKSSFNSGTIYTYVNANLVRFGTNNYEITLKYRSLRTTRGLIVRRAETSALLLQIFCHQSRASTAPRHSERSAVKPLVMGEILAPDSEIELRYTRLFSQEVSYIFKYQKHTLPLWKTPAGIMFCNFRRNFPSQMMD